MKLNIQFEVRRYQEHVGIVDKDGCSVMSVAPVYVFEKFMSGITIKHLDFDTTMTLGKAIVRAINKGAKK